MKNFNRIPGKNVTYGNIKNNKKLGLDTPCRKYSLGNTGGMQIDPPWSLSMVHYIWLTALGFEYCFLCFLFCGSFVLVVFPTRVFPTFIKKCCLIKEAPL